MSMITEQIKRLKDEADLVERTHDYTAKLLREAADTIETLSAKVQAANMERSTAYYNGGWIPVSERLPEGLLVKTLVSCEDSLGLPIVPKVALYDNYEHSWKCEEKVIAWMPLPKPYEPQEREG